MLAAMILFMILALVTLPVWLWSKSKTLTYLSSFFSAVFFIIYRNFAFGLLRPWHDTNAHLKTWFAIMNKWVEAGADLGWCPYLGGGEPISIFSNFMVWAPGLLILKIAHLINLNIELDVLFNLTLMGSIVAFSVGGLLLLHLLTNNEAASLFGFSLLLFGGLFFNELISGVVYALILPIPYLIFFTAHSLKRKTWHGLYFFSLVMGISLNRYIPQYIVVTLFVIAFSAFIYYPKKILNKSIYLLKKRPYALILCVSLMLSTGLPGIFSFSGFKDYLSPTRGFSEGGSITSTDQGFHKPANAPIYTYENLYNRTNIYSHISPQGQLPFYIGVLGVILLLSTRPTGVAGVFMLSGLIVGILSLGYDTPLWGWIISKIPLMNFMRHSFQFSLIAAFLFVISLSLGLSRFLRDQKKYYNIFWVITVSTILYGIRPNPTVIVMGVIFCLTIFSLKPYTKKNKMIAVSIIFLLSMSDLIGNSVEKKNIIPKNINSYCGPMQYPQQWTTTYDSPEHFMPFDYHTFYTNQALWMNRAPRFTFMINRKFYDFMMKYELLEKCPLSGNIFFLADSDDEKTLGKLNNDIFVKNDVNQNGRITQLPSSNPNRVGLMIDSRQDCALVRFENYHEGWTATIDGKSAVIGKTGDNFQVINIPSGVHKVVFNFRSIYMFLINLSMWTSVIGWICMMLWLKSAKPAQDK